MTRARRSPIAALICAAIALAVLPGCGLVENAEAIVEHLEREAVEDATEGQLTAEQIAQLTPWDELRVGDCISDYGWVDGQLWYGMKVVDCADPHFEEVYLLFEHPEGTYPGDDAVYADADDACLSAFETYVGEEYDQSDLLFSAYPPTKDGWQAGDRTSICLLADYDYAELVGSIGDGTARLSGS